MTRLIRYNCKKHKMQLLIDIAKTIFPNEQCNLTFTIVLVYDMSKVLYESGALLSSSQSQCFNLFSLWCFARSQKLNDFSGQYSIKLCDISWKHADLICKRNWRHLLAVNSVEESNFFQYMDLFTRKEDSIYDTTVLLRTTVVYIGLKERNVCIYKPLCYYVNMTSYLQIDWVPLIKIGRAHV